MALRAGQLNKRVTLQTKARTSDGGGGGTDAWTDTATVWARIEPLEGQERYEAQQIEATLSHRITIRHRTVNPKQRFKYGERAFNIKSAVNPEERGEFLRILCEEVSV